MSLDWEQIEADIADMKKHKNMLEHNLHILSCPMSGSYNQQATRAVREELDKTNRRLQNALTLLERCNGV